MAKVGALRVTLGANTAQFEAGMRRAQTSARRTGQDVTRSMEQMRARSVTSMASIRTAAAQLGVGLSAVAFVQFARGALEYASSLGETARAIGVTVEQLQVLQRAALANGASTEGMERAIAILNRTLGQARAGVQGAVQSFRALRIDPEQFRSAGEVLPVVMDRIRGLRTESEQAAAAQRLMGRGAAELLPFLVQGARGYEDMSREAHEAGIVTDEMARRADEAADRLAALAQTAKTNLAIALVGVLGPIEDVVAGLFRIAGAAQTAIASLLNVLGLQNQVANGAQAAPHAPTLWEDMTRFNGVVGPVGMIIGAVRHLGRSPQPAAPRRSTQPNAVADTGTQDLNLGGSHRTPHHRAGGGGAAAAERQRDQALRDDADFESQLRRLRSETLRAQQDQTGDAAIRADFEQQLLAIDREEYEAGVELRVRLGDLTRAKADQLLAANAAADVERQQAIELDRHHELQRRSTEIGEARFNVQADALREEVDGADTATERRRAEMRLLDLTYRQERARLEAVLADERASPAAVEEARLRLERLGQWRASQEGSIRRSTMGPMEEFLDRLPTTAERANEALERIAVDGLQSITDGLADAILMTRSWGDMFKNVARQILADLLRMQIQRLLVAPLARAMGGGNEGGGGILGALGLVAGAAQQMPGASIKIPGKAAGGPVIPGRTYVVGEKGPELLTMGRQHGFVTPNGAGPSRVQIVPSPYFDAVVDGRVVRTGAPMVAAGMSSARSGAQADLHRRASRRLP